ncbi:hypothetical protein [Nonomuraea sp. NPDC003201]
MTLLIGDRVIVAGGGYRVEPGAGREAGFMGQVHGGHLYVIPSDALPLIAQGRLDRRLFADGVAGRAGTDVSATGTVTLAGAGKMLATSGITDRLIALPERCELRAELPAGAASYTLSTSMSRQSVLSTRWRRLRLEMSADDGATWHAVPVAASGSGWTALVRNPATPGFVSLRVTAQNGSGGGLTQTIVRAYAVGPAV